MAKKQKNQDAPASTLDLLDETDHSPFVDNPAAPEIARQRRSQQTMRRWFQIVAALVILGFLTVAMKTCTEIAKPPETVDSLDVSSSVGKPVAVDELVRWLEADPAPVEGGRMVSWDGVEIIPVPEEQDPEDVDPNIPNYATEIHHFTVVDAKGRVYAAFVTVRSNPTLGAVVVAAPSIMPVAPSADKGDWGAVTPWYGYSASQAKEPVVRAVDTWAAAFTGGDPEELRLVVGDGDSTRSYMPLGAASDGKATIIASGLKLTSPDGGKVEDPSMMLVRVEIRASLNGQPTSTYSPSELTGREPIVFDVLVQGADTASPRVVSWGAPGTGPSLEPYSVGISGRDIGAATATPEPTGSIAPSGTSAPAGSAAPSQTPAPAGSGQP